MTLFDLIAIVVVLLSIVAGFSNGAVREVVGLCAFGLAVVGAVLLLPLSGPIALRLVHPSWASSAAAVVVSFLVIYIALQVAGRLLTARLHDSGLLGGVDRVVGGGIGVARAAVVLGAFYLVYSTLTPTAVRPAWIERAALLPLAASAGRALQAIAPKGLAAAGRLGPSIGNALGGPDPGAGASPANESEKDEAVPTRYKARMREPADASHRRNSLGVVLEKPR